MTAISPTGATRASDLMTSSVLTVTPDTPVSRIAELLLAHGVSAVPVVDADGAPLGIISETDLVARSASGGGASKRRWCVTVLAGKAGTQADFMRGVDVGRTARDVMSAPVVTIAEHTALPEILQLMTRHGVKRLPVTRGGRIVGIVSRADLLRAIAAADATGRVAERPRSRLAETLARIDRLFHERSEHRGDERNADERARTDDGATPAGVVQAAPDPVLSANDFRAAARLFKQHEAAERAEQRHLAEERHKHDIETILGQHMSEDAWRHILLGARIAAEHGEKEYMALRIPRETTSDNGRAINVAETGWQATLRGEGAELYHRFETELKPRGFHLVARTLEYPDGVPGDIGLFLAWGAAN